MPPTALQTLSRSTAFARVQVAGSFGRLGHGLREQWHATKPAVTWEGLCARCWQHPEVDALTGKCPSCGGAR